MNKKDNQRFIKKIRKTIFLCSSYYQFYKNYYDILNMNFQKFAKFENFYNSVHY